MPNAPAALAQTSWNMNTGQVEFILIALIAACAVALVFVLRKIDKRSTRIGLSIVLVAVGAGLWVQRDALKDCEGQCECRVFGRTLDIEDPDAICPD